MTIQFKTLGSFEILLIYGNFKIVLAFSPINCKTPLICFIGNTVTDFGSKHHLVAIHIVVHDIFKLRLQCFLIYFKELDLVIWCDLDSNIAFYVEYQSTWLNAIILDPFTPLCEFFFFNFEKQNLTGTSYGHAFVEYKIHLAKIHISHSIKYWLLNLWTLAFVVWNDITISLPIKWIYFTKVRVEEAFVWEIFYAAIKLLSVWLIFHLHSFSVENEMVMYKFMVVEDIYEYLVIIDKTTHNKRIRETINSHCPII